MYVRVVHNAGHPDTSATTNQALLLHKYRIEMTIPISNGTNGTFVAAAEPRVL